jgi:hypothetical protein
MLVERGLEERSPARLIEGNLSGTETLRLAREQQLVVKLRSAVGYEARSEEAAGGARA